MLPNSSESRALSQVVTRILRFSFWSDWLVSLPHMLLRSKCMCSISIFCLGVMRPLATVIKTAQCELFVRFMSFFLSFLIWFFLVDCWIFCTVQTFHRLRCRKRIWSSFLSRWQTKRLPKPGSDSCILSGTWSLKLFCALAFVLIKVILKKLRRLFCWRRNLYSPPRLTICLSRTVARKSLIMRLNVCAGGLTSENLTKTPQI